MTLRSTIGGLVRRAGMERPVNRVILLQRRARATLRKVPWKLSCLMRVARPPRFDVLRGSVTPGSVPVVMCLWNRRERIDDILRLLDGQVAEHRVRLVLWNNRSDDDGFYRNAIAAAPLGGSLASVEFRSDRVNLGGIGRFLAIRRLRRDGYAGPVITVDDDQDFSRHFVADALAAYRPRSVAGWWAFLQDSTYWDRLPVPAGDPATYVGTGGAVFDSSIVNVRRFFIRLPARFGFLEDSWMCHVARRSGWSLTKLETPIEFVLAEQDQGHTLAELKDEFYAYLRPRENAPW